VSAEDLSFDRIAASLRADGVDVQTFAEGLAVKLEAALPGQTTVRRARSGLRGPRHVTAIDVSLSGGHFRLERHGDQLTTTRALVSGGIVLKTEPLPPAEWIDAITEALAVEAQRSATAREALERLLL
jgi:hypothetical protein